MNIHCETLLIVLSCFILVINSYIIDPGPKVIATKGEAWPKPQYQISSDLYSVVRSSVFQFEVNLHEKFNIIMICSDS